jgi:hypothetical protein
MNFDLPHLPDHRLGGRAVVPAVDIMARLARVVREQVPSCDLQSIGTVRLSRVLGAEELAKCTLSVRCEGQGPVRATLESVMRMSCCIERTREHASVEFGVQRAAPLPIPPAFEPEFTLEAARAYESLVPFGPWFHNLKGPLALAPQGACAAMATPQGAEPDELLGSPFLLDAAMHLSCVWGQRYAGVTAIPVGLASRLVLRPIPSGQASCELRPTAQGTDRLLFDLWLLDGGGNISEVVRGLALMPQRSFSVPGWVRDGAPAVPRC